MNITCNNCGHRFKGKFCNKCGQSADIQRINFSTIWLDIRHIIFRFDEKIVFTIKQLCYRPGYAIDEYLKGKRLNYFQPISFVVLVASAYALLIHLFHLHIITDHGDSNSIFARLGVDESNDWMVNHYSWIALLTVPFFTISTFLVFRKQGYNLAEHLIINSFLSAQRVLFLILSIPLLYLLIDTSYFTAYTIFNLFIEFILMFWGLSQLFTKLSKTKLFFLLVFAFSIMLALLISVSALIVLALEWFVLKT
jgi:hypothetical protein